MPEVCAWRPDLWQRSGEETEGMQETRRRGEELEPTDMWWVMQEGS